MKINDTAYQAQAKDFRQRFLILHYTTVNFKTSIDKLTGQDVSSHYVIPTLKNIDPTYPDDELIVYSLVPETDRAWHAGTSSWQERTALNDSSIGIEIVNQADGHHFVSYPNEQIKLLITLCQDILYRYPNIRPNNVLGHSDIAVGRKVDPGPLFPWKILFDNGIGAWYDEDTMAFYKNEFQKKMPSVEDVVRKLNVYGYRYQGDILTLLKTFQMHFRPENYSGKLDITTAAIAYALVDKYISSYNR